MAACDVLTCVGDAALLTLLPGLVDDADPHQRRGHDAGHHGDDDDAHGDGAGACRRRWHAGSTALHHHQLAVSALCAQRVGHEAGVAAGVVQDGGADDQQLVPWREVVAL